MSNYATKKELEQSSGIDTSDVTAKKAFITLNTEGGKLDINKLTNGPTNLNDLKTQEMI